jgi:hypothetical protein
MEKFDYSQLLDEGDKIKKLHPFSIIDIKDFIERKERNSDSLGFLFQFMMEMKVTVKGETLGNLHNKFIDITNESENLFSYSIDFLKWLLEESKK